MNEPIGTFILDFQTINFEQDAKIAKAAISELQSACNLENQYALDPPMERAGWAFAKLFLSGQFVEKLVAGRGYEIEKSKGRKLPDKFISWLANELKSKGCGAQIKQAQEMREL